MIACDLMIGDYLLWNGLPLRVAQVSTPTIAGDMYDGFMLENGEEDCGEPIKLTAETLKQIGFVKDESPLFAQNDVWFLGDTFWLLQVARHPYGWNVILRFRHQNITGLVIKYVHELQHFLRLCRISYNFELKRINNEDK